MTLLTHIIEIDRPADVVAATYFDWTQDRRWRPAVRCLTVHPSGPAVEGQRIIEALRFWGTTYVTPTRIDAVRPRRVLWSGSSRALMIRGWRDVEPVGPDRCRVTAVVDVELTGARRRLTPLLAMAYGRLVQADLRRLDSVVREAVLVGR